MTEPEWKEGLASVGESEWVPEIGAVVRLRSGGCAMVVMNIEPPTGPAPNRTPVPRAVRLVHTAWLDDRNQPHREWFPLGTLQRY